MPSPAFTRIYQGQYREVIVPVVDTNGDAVDLTSVNLIVWGFASASGIVIQKSYPASGITIPDPTTGKYTVIISGSETADLALGDYHQQSFVDLQGKYVPTVDGVVRISPTIF